LLVGGTWFECFYMTMITLSTTGFGETLPGLSASPAGRAFTVVLMVVGMGLVVYVISLSTAFLVEGQLGRIWRRRSMDKAIAKLSDHVIVCGIGTTGVEIIAELLQVGTPFVAIEGDPVRLERAVARFRFNYIAGDATTEEVLIQAGAHRARGVITVLPSDKDNLYVTFMARQLNPALRIVARGVEPGGRERLLRAGASTVVYPNHIGGLRMASELLRPHVVGFLDRMLRPGEETWRIEEVEVTAASSSAGRRLGDLDVQRRVGLPVLALTHDEGRDIIYYPKDDTILREGCRLVVLGERSQVTALRKLVEAG
jgi:voltage-gated potassium channel